MRAIALVLLFGLFSPVSAAAPGSGQPDLVPVKPVRITAYRQLTGNGWNNSTASRYNSAPATGQPRTVAGALQNVGGALLEGAQSGIEETGRRLGNAGQDLGNAVDGLSGGAIGRVNNGIRQSFDNVNQTASGWTNQSAGNQAAYNSAGATNAQPAYAPVASVRPPQLQITRSQLPQASTQNNGYPAPPLAGTNTVGTNNQSGGLNDPGQSPFGRTNNRNGLNFPSGQNSHAGHNHAGHDHASHNHAQPQTNAQTNPAQTANTWQGSNSAPYRNNDMVNVTPVENGAIRTNNIPANNQNTAGNQAHNNRSYTTNGNPPNSGSPWYSGGNTATINSQTPTNTGSQSPFYRNNNVPNNTAQGNNTSQGYNPRTTGYATQPNTQGANSQRIGTQGNVPRSSNPYARLNNNQNVGNGQVPASESKWLPLMMTGVALMGSIGANLFLGFGYLDARHKYLSTIRRGSRSFSRIDESRAA